jgi:glucose-1-phosphate thymidylyltransferase
MTSKGIIVGGISGVGLLAVNPGRVQTVDPGLRKSMIYYQLSTLKLVGIRDILLISTSQDTPRFKNY